MIACRTTNEQTTENQILELRQYDTDYRTRKFAKKINKFFLYCIVPFGKQEWQSDYGTWEAVISKNIKLRSFFQVYFEMDKTKLNLL